MLGYEQFKLASDFADTETDTHGAQWAPKEGINYEEMVRFAGEQGIAMSVLPWPGPAEALAFGIIFGIRIANLAHRIENVDPIDVLKD